MPEAQEVPLPHPEQMLEGLMSSSGYKFLLREIFDQSLEALARDGWEAVYRKFHPMVSLFPREQEGPRIVREAIVEKQFEVFDAPVTGHGFRDSKGYRIDADAEIEFGKGEKMPVTVTYFFQDYERFLGPDALIGLRQGDTMDMQGRVRVGLDQYFETLLGMGMYGVGRTHNHSFGFDIGEIANKIVKKTREALKLALGELPQPLHREVLGKHTFDDNLWHDGVKTSSVMIYNQSGHLIKLRRKGEEAPSLNAGYIPFDQVSADNRRPYVQLSGSQVK